MPLLGWSWLTGSGSGGGGNAFGIIQTPAGTSPTATTSSDTLTLTSSNSSLTITGNSATKTVDITGPIILSGSNLYSSNSTAPGGGTTTNISLGSSNLSSGTYTGNSSVFIGSSIGTLANGTATNNVYIGASGLTRITTGVSNVFVGGSSAAFLTSGSANIGLGNANSPALTTGTSNIAIGSGAGQVNTTGSNNIHIGTSTGAASTFTNLSNTIILGNSVRASSSNVCLIGGVTNPVNVGIRTLSPSYPLDVVGDINITGNYRTNGAIFSPWLTSGNGLSGGEFLGSTNNFPVKIQVNNAQQAVFEVTGFTGFQKTVPDANVHAGATIVSLATPGAITTATNLSSAVTPYVFGASGNKNYSIYSKQNVGGVPTFSPSSSSTTYTEPTVTGWDVTSFGYSVNSGTGYDTSVDPPPTYDMWGLYATSSIKSVNSVTVSVGSWPIAGFADVTLSWTAPANSPAPDAYYLVRNSTDYIILPGNIVNYNDDNTGWNLGSANPAAIPAITYYTVDLSWGSAGGSILDYRLLNTTNSTYHDVSGVLVANDDGAWSGGSAVSPSSSYYGSLKSDGAIAGGIVAQSSDFFVNLGAKYYIVTASGGNVNAYLPALPSGVVGYEFSIKNYTGGSTVTVEGNGFNIDGASNYVLNSAGNFVSIVTDGNTWHIVSKG